MKRCENCKSKFDEDIKIIDVRSYGVSDYVFCGVPCIMDYLKSSKKPINVSVSPSSKLSDALGYIKKSRSKSQKNIVLDLFN